MWDNFVFLVIFDTCDVVYKWFISLLPPIVLDNLFDNLNIYVEICALPMSIIFPIKVNMLNLELFNQTENIPMVLRSSPIQIWGKSVKGFISCEHILTEIILYTYLPAFVAQGTHSYSHLLPTLGRKLRFYYFYST